MLAEALATEMLPRMQNIGLVDINTGFTDGSEVDVYIGQAIRYLAFRYQLQHFLRMCRELFRTTQGVETYDLPPTYGFIVPREHRRSGIAINTTDNQGPVNLEYYDPVRYNLTRTNTEDKPAWFTVAENVMYLQPVPDTIYVIEAVFKPVQDNVTIPDDYVEAVMIQTLWRMASDKVDSEKAQRALPALMAERTEILRTLVNNEQRMRQMFNKQSSYAGYSRGYRRYGR